MKNTISILIFLHLILFSSALLAQCMTYEVPLKERVENSELIVEGEVVFQKSFWNSEHSLIYTSSTLEISKIFKNSLKETKYINIVTKGGVVGDTLHKMDPNLVLSIGDVGVFFGNQILLFPYNSETYIEYAYEPFALQQGFIKINKLEGDAHDLYHHYHHLNNDLYKNILSFSFKDKFKVLKNVSYGTNVQTNTSKTMVPPTITSIVPGGGGNATAGMLGTIASNIITINGNNFGASQNANTDVEFRDANNGGAGFVAVNNIVSWNNTQIVCQVPTQAGTGTIRVTNDLAQSTISTVVLTIDYNHLNVNSGGTRYLPDLINDNGTGGYTFVYNTTFSTTSAGQAVQAFERALQTWRCATFVNFNVSGTTATVCDAADGINLVSFDAGGCERPAGVLGTCMSYWSSCGGGVWYTYELDVIYDNEAITWNYNVVTPIPFSQYDFESVTLHELGHGHGLGHVIDNTACMHYALSNGQTSRTLKPLSELAGGNQAMSRYTVANACGPTQMIALNSSNCAITAPIADFSANSTSVCSGVGIDFTDLSANMTGTGLIWNWTFTGGVPATSNLQNPTGVTWAAPGTYSVSLTVTNASGTDTNTSTNYITILPSPTANFTGSPTTICEGASVTFQDASIDNPTSWSWTFSGGTPASSTNQDETVTYASAGSYNVTLQATNTCGTNSLTLNNYITVNVCPPPAPVANFSANTLSGCAPLTVNFSDLSTNTPTGWSWNFTGGTPATSTNQNESVTFNLAGIYTVSLQASNAGGSDMETKTAYITVYDCPNANFTESTTTACTGDAITFTDASTGSPTSWLWSFPGGTPSSAAIQNPVITYNSPGTYDVVLTSSNVNGSSTITKTNRITVSICTPPVEDFVAAPTTICSGQSVQFTDLSTNSPSSWSWNFGDPAAIPATSTAQNPTVVFPNIGTWNITLTATNTIGAGAGTTKNNYIEVVSCPASSVGLLVNDGCGSGTDVFVVQNGIDVYVWGGIINQDNGTNYGVITNRGTMFISGDFTNNSVNTNAFAQGTSGLVNLNGGAPPLNVGGPQLITGWTQTNFNSLELSGTGVKTMTINSQVEDSLILNDRELATQDFIMYVTNPSTSAITRTGGLPGNSSLVEGFVSSTNNGKLRRATNSTSEYIYPVGSSIGTARYRPVGIIPSSATASFYDVRFVNNDPTTDGLSVLDKEIQLGNVNNLWYQKIARDEVTPAPNAQIKLYFDETNDNASPAAQTTGVQWGFVAPYIWRQISVTATGNASPTFSDIVSIANVGNFLTTENFTISTLSPPLDLNLISFICNCENKTNVLKWSVIADENVTSEFIVERKTEGSEFVEIGKGNVSSVSNDMISFNYSDKESDGNYFYRIKQISNSKPDYSNVIKSVCNSKTGIEYTLGLFPNPTTGILNLNMNLSDNQTIVVKVIGQLGNEVYINQINCLSGFHSYDIDLSELASGAYYITLQSDTEFVIRKILKND